MNRHTTPGQILIAQDGSTVATQQEKAVDIAIGVVRDAFAYTHGEQLYIAFSGGKDSVVLRDVVIRAAELEKVPLHQFAEFHYHITGIDPPPLIYFMRREFGNIRLGTGDLHWNMYEKSMWKLIEEKGPPTRIRRFCCEYLKEKGGTDRHCCTGVRWAESNNRANNRATHEILGKRSDKKMLFNDNDEFRRQFEICSAKHKYVHNPIVHFTDDNVWEYIHDRKLPYCELYDQGYERLGCIGCPMATAKRKQELEEYPGFKNLYIMAFDRFIKNRKEWLDYYNWHTGQDAFDWWMDDRNMDKPLPGQLEWEDMEW